MPVIILDMDETLLHTPESQFALGRSINPIKRPGLKVFLETMKQMGLVWVLSAGSADYIPVALESAGVMPYIQGWRSSRRDNNIAKSIINGKSWVLVDDRSSRDPLTIRKLQQCGISEQSTLRNGNLITVRPFHGDMSDRVLTGLPGLVGASLAMQRFL